MHTGIVISVASSSIVYGRQQRTERQKNPFVAVSVVFLLFFPPSRSEAAAMATNLYQSARRTHHRLFLEEEFNKEKDASQTERSSTVFGGSHVLPTAVRKFLRLNMICVTWKRKEREMPCSCVPRALSF